ncbi:MAG TPA: tetratricopeptide repeat protein [Planctomicrobium sp.]|nr:tetratricopeptide repeat protein [Planctomicrobium sp.]
MSIADQASRSSVSLVTWLVGLAVVFGMAYANSFGGQFVFDDIVNIADSARTQSLWTWNWSGEAGPRFLWFLSLAIDYSLWGRDAWGYHLLNGAVHLANGFLIFGLVRRTLKRLPGDGWSANAADATAFAVAALWLAHPLTTQAVTYIVQRGESLATLAYLGVLYGVCRAGEPGARSLPWLILSAGAFYIGMHVKEIVATAPAVAALYERAFLRCSWREVISKRWRFAASLLPAYWWCFRLFPSYQQRPPTMGFGYAGVTPLEYLANQPSVILHYLKLSVCPDVLLLDYGWPVARTPGEWVIPASVVSGLLLASAVLYLLRPAWGFCLCAFFLVLAPTSSIVPIADLAYEHRMYLPLAFLITGVVIAAVAGIVPLMRRQNRSLHWRMLSLSALFLIVLAGSVWRTIERNRDYADPIKIWTQVTIHAPHHFRGFGNLGTELGLRGRLDEAEQAFQKSLELNPAYKRGVLGLARCHWLRGKTEVAERLFQEVLKSDDLSLMPQTQIELGALLISTGRPDEAEPLLRAATSSAPHHIESKFNLSTILCGRGDDAAAVRLLEEVLLNRPRYDRAYLELAWIFATSPDDDILNPVRAGEAFLLSARKRPATSNRQRQVNAAVAAAQGDFSTAVRLAEEALKIACESQRDRMAVALRQELAMYRERRPYRRQIRGPGGIPKVEEAERIPVLEGVPW